MKYRCPLSAQRGASLVEYSLLVALISVVVVGGVTGIGKKTKCSYDRSASAIGGGMATVCLIDEEVLEESGPGMPSFGTGGQIPE